MTGQVVRDFREANEQLALSFGRDMVSRGFSEHSQRAYARTIAELIDLFGSRPVASASRADIHIFLTKLLDRGLAPVSINRHLHAARTFFRFLQRVGFIIRDPMLQVSDRKIVAKKERRVLTIQEIETLIAAARDPFERAVCELFYGSAIRVSELCALRLEDVDLVSNVVKIVRGKGGKDRYSLFGSHAAKAIAEYLEWRKPMTFLFELSRHHGELMRLPKSWGARIYIDGVQRYFGIGTHQDLPTEQDAREAMDKITARLPGFHLGGGVPWHSSIHSTQHYTFLTIDDLHKIYERTHPHAK